MKEVVLFVDGKTVGPFSAEDVQARFSAGEFSAETPCAEPGAAEWKPLGEVFPAKKTVRIARKTQQEEEEMKTAVSEKLDPEVRKKLLLYNLADAISVDKFTPVQADVAIRAHEAELQKGKKLKIAAGVGGFVVACGLASLLFNCVNVAEAPGGQKLKIFDKIFETPPNPELKKASQRMLLEISRLNDVRKECESVRFTAPRGQGDPRPTFLSNVEIKNPDISDVTGTLDVSAITGTLPEELRESATFEVVQLSRVDSKLQTLIAEQDRLCGIMAAPCWDDAALRAALVKDLASAYPMDPSVPESTEIWKALRLFKVEGVEAQLALLGRRVAELAQNKNLTTRFQEQSRARFKRRAAASAEKDGGNAARAATRIAARQAASQNALKWASEKMPKFIEKLTDWLAEKEICYSPEARRDAWVEFVENRLPQIQEAVEKNEMQRAPVAADGSFTLPGRNSRNILAVGHLGRVGDVYFVPATENVGGGEESAGGFFVSLKNLAVNRKTLTPEDVLMDERYKVVAKQKAGRVPVAASGKIGGREIFIVRTTPEWFYVTVEKVRDEDSESRRKTTVLLGVPADFYETVAVGEEVPMEKLLTFERFGRPAESSSSGRLMEIPENRLEAVKEQQESAGFAFPPPPEQPAPPLPPKKKEAPSASSDEAASSGTENAPDSESVPEDAPARETDAETAGTPAEEQTDAAADTE